MKPTNKQAKHLALLAMSIITPSPDIQGQGTEASRSPIAAKELRETLQPKTSFQPKRNAPWQDTLSRLIHDLDTGSGTDRNSPAFRAIASLDQLGSLMVPSLIKELDRMGPFGLMNASKLLSTFPDENLAPLVERFLKDSSPVRQEFAAKLLPKLDPKDQAKLYPQALSSKRDKVRLAGFLSMIRLKKPKDEILTQMFQAFKEGRSSTKIEILKIMRAKKLYTDSRGKNIFQQAVHSPEGPVFDQAIRMFLDSINPYVPSYENEALALLEKLPKERQVTMLDLIAMRKPRWPNILLKAIETPSTNTHFIIKALEAHSIPLPEKTIFNLLSRRDEGLLDFLLNQLSARKDLLPRMSPLLNLLENPNSRIRSRTSSLIFEKAPELLLKSPKFLQDPLQSRVSYIDKISILGRVQKGHWPQQMFGLWKDMEAYEGIHLGRKLRKEKNLLANIMSEKLTDQDWPWIQEFILEPHGEPQAKGQIGFTRDQLLKAILRKKVLTPEIQLKALALSPKVSRQHMKTILGQIGKALTFNENRPRLEALAFKILGTDCRAKNPEGDSGEFKLSRYYLAAGIFLRILAHLPSSSYDKYLWKWLQSSQEDLVSLSSGALQKRINNRREELIRYYLTILESPFLIETIGIDLEIPLLIDDPKLQEAVCKGLQGGLLRKIDSVTFQDYLNKLDAATRKTLVIQILKKNKKGIESDMAEVLLKTLGSFHSADNIPIFKPYLQNPDPTIKQAALQAIGETFSLKAVPILLESLKDMALKKTAKAGLRALDEYTKEKVKWEKRFPRSAAKKD
jgi:hypothetical protein